MNCCSHATKRRPTKWDQKKMNVQFFPLWWRFTKGRPMEPGHVFRLGQRTFWKKNLMDHRCANRSKPNWTVAWACIRITFYYYSKLSDCRGLTRIPTKQFLQRTVWLKIVTKSFLTEITIFYYITSNSATSVSISADWEKKASWEKLQKQIPKMASPLL